MLLLENLLESSRTKFTNVWLQYPKLCVLMCILEDIKDPIFEVGDHVRISKYENVFAKSYIPNWSEDEFMIQKVKNTVLCA